MKTAVVLLASALCAMTMRADSVLFPAGLIPFNAIANQTAPDASGNTLVLGYTNPALLAALASIPLPASPGETFSNAKVELAPGVFFSNVFLPTLAQRVGNFSAFTEPLINPLTGIAFPQNFIPTRLLFGDNGFFAFEVGPQPSSATPEPSALYLVTVAGFLAGAWCLTGKARRAQRSERS